MSVFWSVAGTFTSSVIGTTAITGAVLNPLVAQLTHRAFPEMADALRSATDVIGFEWEQIVRDALPAVELLTPAELLDSVPQILPAMADALGSDDPEQIHRLLEVAPKQGQSRIRHKLDVTQVMLEDRLLRALIVEHVEEGLGRRMGVAEAAALHTVIDVMLHRSVIALLSIQISELRAAAETELKHLAFLSHDLNNALHGISLSHDLLRARLRHTGQFTEELEIIDAAQAAIDRTVGGMQKLLEHERLRKGARNLAAERVELRALVTGLIERYGREARDKGLQVMADVPADAVVHSDRELITLVLQNLVGNAIKYSTSGKITVGARQDQQRGTSVWVSDEGPGIPPETLGVIFEAFRRGEVHEREGVGLGLAIAAQAAKLLEAGLTVESVLGKGSTFRLALRPENTNVQHL